MQEFSDQDASQLLQFVQQTRAIMDCKFSEYSFYDDHRQYSRFPEFVYSWLNTFEYKAFRVQACPVFNEAKFFTYYRFLEKVSEQLWVTI